MVRSEKTPAPANFGGDPREGGEQGQEEREAPLVLLSWNDPLIIVGKCTLCVAYVLLVTEVEFFFSRIR